MKFFPIRSALYIGLFTTIVIGAHAATSVHISNRPANLKPPFTLASVMSKILTNSTVSAADKTATKGMRSSSDKKTISFSQHTVRLVVHTGPENDMLSYRIDGLRNPTIALIRGCILKVLFVNNDGDMFHDIRFGAKPRSFENDTQTLLRTSVGTAPLPHVNEKTLHGDEMIIKAPDRAGKYAYFCTVRGHAQGGMWGIIQIR